MDELIKIIGGACLKHHDSGESSCNREARLILLALRDYGYQVVKIIDAKPSISDSIPKRECDSCGGKIRRTHISSCPTDGRTYCEKCIDPDGKIYNDDFFA